MESIRKTALIKLSGDIYSDENVLLWVKDIADKYFTVICVGGGTQINKAFSESGFKRKKHGPLGRDAKTFGERQLARDILENNQVKLQDELYTRGIQASVVIPVLNIGTVLCHANGDIFVLAAYHGYDKIYVATKKSRAAKKKKAFLIHPKIEVKGF